VLYYSNENKNVTDTEASGDAKSCVCLQSNNIQGQSEQDAVDVYNTGPAHCWISVIWHRPSLCSLYRNIHDNELAVERLNMV